MQQNRYSSVWWLAWIVLCVLLGVALGAYEGVAASHDFLVAILGSVKGLACGLLAGLVGDSVIAAAREMLAEPTSSGIDKTAARTAGRLTQLVFVLLLAASSGGGVGRLVDDLANLFIGIAGSVSVNATSDILFSDAELTKAVEAIDGAGLVIGGALGILIGLVIIAAVAVDAVQDRMRSSNLQGEKHSKSTDLPRVHVDDQKTEPKPLFGWPKGLFNRIAAVAFAVNALYRIVVLANQLWSHKRLFLLEIREYSVEITLLMLALSGVLLFSHEYGRKYPYLMLAGFAMSLGQVIVDVSMAIVVSYHFSTALEIVNSTEVIPLEVAYTFLHGAASVIFVLALLRGERIDYAFRDLAYLIGGSKDSNKRGFIQRASHHIDGYLGK